MIFKGCGVALITPFDEHNNVNYDKLEELIEFQIKNSIDSIVICGTTAEASTLSHDEKEKIIEFSIQKINKRVPVIIGTGGNNTIDAISQAKFAQNAGADGLLVVTPYYNKCTQKGLYLHYKEIANSVTIPILLYNVPSRTGVNIEPETLLQLSEISNICGIKEASGNISQIAKMASLIPKDFAIYSGNDDQILPILSLGGVGVISVLANILPKETHNMCQAFFDGDIQRAQNLQLKYLDLINTLFIEVNPMPIKEALNILNYNVGSCRLPLCDMSEKNKEILKNSLKIMTRKYDM